MALPVIEIPVPDNIEIDGRCANGLPGDDELRLLCYLAQQRQPRTIFEFGTFTGRTAVHLAKYAPAAVVRTLDLPAGSFGGLFSDVADAAHAARRDIAGDLPGVYRHYGDSAAYDFHFFIGVMDFIWVDAGHSHAACFNDSLRAYTIRRAGGLIAWHDYASIATPEVMDVLDFLYQHSPLFTGLQHVANTTVALLGYDSKR